MINYNKKATKKNKRFIFINEDGILNIYLNNTIKQKRRIKKIIRKYY